MSTRMALLAALALLGASLLNAQTNATLTGTVTDSSGAVIPGAEVSLVNPASGETYSSASNAAGTYNIPFIKPGTYDLTISSAGFKQYTRPGIVLDTAANVRADAALELGEVTEVITVEADVPLLKTENSSVGSVVKNKTIANMPLINRRAAQLVRLSGFVVQRGTGSQFQIAGGRSNNAMWTLDGGSTQNILLGVASLNFDPPIEALEEMNVEVSNYKAEMGRSGGGFVQMTTKAGTNQFHGAAYEFLRNDALDSRQFFSAQKQKLRRNQFGYAIGGPIVKNRTFFFWSQEFITNKTANPVINNIPDQADLSGDLSSQGAINNPWTGDPVPNSIIPRSEMDPVGVELAKFWPAPNVSGSSPRRNNFQGLNSSSTPSVTNSLRVDHTINDKHRLYGRYVSNLSGKSGNRTQGLGLFPSDVHPSARILQAQYYNWSVTGISNFSPRLVGEYRFTWNWRQWHPRIPQLVNGDRIPEKIGLTGVNPDFFPDVNVTA